MRRGKDTPKEAGVYFSYRVQFEPYEYLPRGHVTSKGEQLLQSEGTALDGSGNK